MSKRPLKSEFLPTEALVEWLKNELSVEAIGAPEDFLKAPDRVRCLANAHFRIDHHFDLMADLLIHDPRLGSLGLVQVLPEADTAEAASRHIDHAAYLRHLLVNAALATQTAATVPNVELVLLVSKVGKSLEAVTGVLRGAIKDTDLLDGVGINILPYDPATPKALFDESERWRTFAWLLHRTGAWLQGRIGSTSATPADATALTGLATRHFRVSGRRALEFDAQSRVHVVHGHNGSGKSSLAEAIELAVTGTLRRLGRDGKNGEYLTVLRNTRAKDDEATQIELRLGQTTKTLTVTETGVEALAPAIDNGMALVLDQSTMDELTRFGDARRAAALLGAFFPEDHKTDRNFREATKKAEADFNALPAPLRSEFGATDAEKRQPEIEARYAWLDEPVATAEGLADCLPLRWAVLTDLSPLLGDVRLELAAWRDKPPEAGAIPVALGRLDSALNSLRPGMEGRVVQLDIAIAALDTLKAWRAGTEASREPYAVRLNRWLHALATVDLAEKSYQVAKTMADAKERHWAPEKPMETALVRIGTGMSDLDKWPQDIETWRGQRNQAYAQIVEEGTGELPGMENGGNSPLKPSLSDRQFSALNETGAWLMPADGAGDARGLGDAIRQSLTEGLPVSLGGIQIGQGDWAVAPLELARRLRAACAEMQETDRERWMAGETRFAAIRRAYESHRALAKLGEDAKKSLAEQLRKGATEDTSLGLALTELTYLFTPARWAYQDLKLALKSGDDGKDGVSLAWAGTKDIPAALRLNSGELYSIAVAMFLLCARRPDNPLKLLVLDDPFQNMDELTVSAVARGIGRLSRLWGENDPWRLLILLHREADVRRFRQEVPCALYRLPWLSPDDTPTDPAVIRNEDKAHSGQSIDLAKIFAIPPKSQARKATATA